MGLLFCNCYRLCKIYLILNVIVGLIFAESTTLKADVPTGPKFIQETKTCTIKAVVDPITHQEIPVSQAIKRGKLLLFGLPSVLKVMDPFDMVI